MPPSLPVALHFARNALQGPTLGLPVSGQQIHAGVTLTRSALTGPPAVTGGMFGLEGGLVGTVVTAAAIVAVVRVSTYRPPVEESEVVGGNG